MYSVTPKYLLFKKYFLEIGPFINLFVLPSLRISNAVWKDFLINRFDFFEIFSKAFFWSNSIFIKLIDSLSSFSIKKFL